MEAAFTNWRLPGYLGSVAYRAQRLSPALFNALMNVRIDLKTRQGPSLLARLRDVNGPAEVFGLDEYETPWLDWAKIDYVLDAGAHVGGFTLWAASRSRCRILAIEPNPATRELLEANIRREHLEDRVAVRAWALAAARATRLLRPAGDSAASSLVRDRASGDVEVEAVDLATAMSASGFPRFDLVKMDIEGAEYEVFASVGRNALRSAAFWIVECHPVAGASPRAVESALRSSGFEVASVDKPLGQQLLIGRR